MDTSSAFNSQTGNYIVPASGHYRLSYGLTKKGSSTAVMHLDSYLNGLNGLNLSKRARADADAYSNVMVTFIASFAQGDAISFRMYGTSGVLTDHAGDLTIQYLG